MASLFQYECVSTNQNRLLLVLADYITKRVGKGGGAGGEALPPQILTHVTLLQKNIKRKKQLSGYN